MKARFAAAAVAAVLLLATVGTRRARAGVQVFPDRGRDAYALVFGDQSTCLNLAIRDIEDIRARFGGDFLWLRRNGAARVVRDPAKLDEAKALFGPLRALEPEQQDLARRQKAVEQKEAAIERQRDAIADDDEEDGEDRADRADLRERDAALRELDAAEREIDAEGRRLDAQERELDRREEALEKAAEAKLWALIDRWIEDGSAGKASEP